MAEEFTPAGAEAPRGSVPRQRPQVKLTSSATIQPMNKTAMPCRSSLRSMKNLRHPFAVKRGIIGTKQEQEV
jgi:hypothetical protein